MSSVLDQKPRPVAWWRALPHCGPELSGKVDVISKEVAAPFIRHSGGADSLPAEQSLMLTISGLSLTCSKEGWFAKQKESEITYSEVCVATYPWHSILPSLKKFFKKILPRDKKSGHPRCGAQHIMTDFMSTTSQAPCHCPCKSSLQSWRQTCAQTRGNEILDPTWQHWAFWFGGGWTELALFLTFQFIILDCCEEWIIKRGLEH